MRIQTVVACAAAVAIGGSLTIVSTVAAGNVGQPGSDAGPSARPKTCEGRQLHTSLGRIDAAAGSYYQNVRFRNAGKRCVVRGWPKIRYSGKGAEPIGFFGSHPRKPPHRLVLRHGETGKVTLQTPNPGNYPPKACRPARATHLATYVPARVRPATHHRNKLDRPMKVCSTKNGRPSVSRLR
ncbi:MAG: DUF4232 domain-containing protein [Nocardioidaceae bacterium]